MRSEWRPSSSDRTAPSCPTSVIRTPDAVKHALSRDQMRLYTVIWERFVASQMSNAIYNTLRVEIAAGLKTSDMPYTFRVSGSTIKFAGFLALYEETRDEDTAPDEDEGRILPELMANELLDLLRLLPEQHFTQPPPRYTEASLVKELERFKEAEMVWCQEEPKNQGSWSFMEPNIEWVLTRIGAKNKRPRYAGRAAAASPATGLASTHKAQQEALVNDALTLEGN